MNSSVQYISKSEDMTRRIGQVLGAMLSPGAVIALQGDLGAGKTVFTKGLAHGLGYADWERVKSPTFTIVNEINAPVPLYHFDIYRLGDVDELLEIGFEEYLTYEGIVVVEWAQKFDHFLPETAFFVTIEHIDSSSRQIEVCASASIVDALRNSIESDEV